MRLLLACAAAVAAVAFAAPSFAQDATPIEAQTPAAPTGKPKAGTSAYCNSLKSTSSKTSCLKRLHASAAKPVVTASSKKKTKGKKAPTDAMSTPKDSAQLTPPASAAPSSAPIQQAQPSSVAVPPLPQKTI